MKEFRLEAPVGRMYTQALREEAALDEKNERFSRAQRTRALADRLDMLTDIYKDKKS